MSLEQTIAKNDVYIIAEVSQNHDGSLGQAHAFIDAVSKTGAHAIKFQTHIASEESTLNEPFRVKFSYQDATRYEYWKRMEWTEEQWRGLYEHAKNVGLDFLSSPFSVKALNMLDQIGVNAWKFGSGEIFNDVLLDKAIQTGKPIIISTGLSRVEDIDKIASKVKANGNQLIIMECTTAYPSKAEDISIKLIPEFYNRYNCVVGISDHSATIYPSLAAITLGAQVVEVHVTMSRDMFGPDVKASVTMDELAQIVNGAVFIKTMLGVNNNKTELNPQIRELKTIFSKSIYANCNLKNGDVLSEDNMAIKKPHNENGIDVSEYYSLIGKKVNCSIDKDEIIEWRHIKE